MAFFSCDTFVALPPATKDGCVIFGKNSDRPSDEVQEVITIPAADHGPGSKLQCTYIEIDQVLHTHAVILSKPAWMWGAEIGANEHGVCIGNEAVWTKECGPGDLDEKLIGMDYVRLGLERSSSAHQALDIITGLLQVHGQGGRCFENPDMADRSYHNSFIIADHTEAWVLETAGKHWVAEKVTSGVRNISNMLTIGEKFTLSSPGLKEHARAQGYWEVSDGEFDFVRDMASAPSFAIEVSEKENPVNRYSCGQELLEKLSKNGTFDHRAMFSILRNEDSGICRVGEGSISTTTASQVSVLPPVGSNKPAVHWFTALPNPNCSMFKPFIFCPGVEVGDLTKSPNYGSADPAMQKPRFQRQVDRRHLMYRSHQTCDPLPGRNANQFKMAAIKELEVTLLKDIDEYVKNYDPAKVVDIFKKAAQAELQIYSKPGGKL